MELLNHQEKELLSKYNKYLSNSKTLEPTKYSDIFIGKHEIDSGQLRDEIKFQNTKMGVKSSSATKRNEFKNIMSELRSAQVLKRENENKNQSSVLIQENSRQKQQQFDQSQMFLIRECLDKPEKQVRQISSISQDNLEQKNIQEKLKCRQSTFDIQRQFNEKLLQQLETLIKKKKIDSKFLFSMIQKHIEECPQFGKRVKEDIKELLQQLL